LKLNWFQGWQMVADIKYYSLPFMCSSRSLQLHTHPCCIHVAQASVLAGA